MNKRRVGAEWEDRACDYLKRSGVIILARNYRCRIGEIDIIGKDNGVFIFVEVKYRKNPGYGMSIEAVTQRKQQTIMKVAQVYLMSKNIPLNVRMRFDVCGFDGDKMTYIKDAF